ncbi:MAG: hypothetical protein M1338_03240 [Patescibacteria group bacterium]|nr:hypothetical protein [Patescibacteria group bacterium]
MQSVKNWQILKYVVLLFSGWFISLLLITYLGLSLLPNQDFFSHKLYFPSENLQYFARWSNWDGGGFRYIAEHGYIPRLTVFFPAYPILIKIFTLFNLNYFWSAFLVTKICTIITLFYFYKLIILDFSENTAKKALFALLIFPTSFYLLAVYSESLTLALAVSAFYYARKEKWLAAGILAGLAGISRLSGLAVVFGVMYEYFYGSQQVVAVRSFWQSLLGRIFLYTTASAIFLNIIKEVFSQKLMLVGTVASVLDVVKWPFLAVFSLGLFLFLKSLIFKLSRKKIFSRNFCYLILACLPFGLYLLYQQISFGSATTFLNSEQDWGKILSAPWQGPLFNLKYVFSHPFSIGILSAHLHVQLAIFILAIICLVISYRRLRISYTIFLLAIIIIPLFSGMLADITRYVLIGFPMFVVLALIKNELLIQTGLILSALMLALLTVLFFNSYLFT